MALVRIAGQQDKVLAAALPGLLKPLGMGVYNRQSIFRRINKTGNKRPWTGESIQGGVVTSTYGKAASYANDDTVNTNTVEPVTAVQWELGGYIVSINLPGMKLRKVGSDPKKLFDLLDAETTLAMNDMYETMSTHLFQAANDAKGIISLSTMTDATTSMAGLAASTAWGGTTTVSGAFSSQGKADLMTLFLQLSRYQGFSKSDTGEDNPNLNSMNATTLQLYWSALESSMRYSPMGVGDVKLNMTFMGQECVKDEHVPAGVWYMLNTNHLWLYVMPDADFTLLPETRDTTQPDMYARAAVWNGQVICDSRRFLGKLTTLT